MSPALAAQGGRTAELASLLRGRSISLDLVGTGTHTLVEPPDGLLGELGLGSDDFRESPRSLDQLADPNLDCQSLPDAIFLLGPLPHPGAANLITHCDYFIRAMPYADALHLTQNHIYAATIPDGAYRLDPAEPRGALQTIGTELLLVSNASIPDRVIEKLLSAILETSFSHLYDPPLTIDQLQIVPEFPQHPGVAAYIDSKQPVTLEGLTTASKVIALVTSAIPITLLLRRWFSQWRVRERVWSVRTLIHELTEIEERARDAKEDPQVLQSQVSRMRATALRKSTVGELRDMELLPAFLAYCGEVSRFLQAMESRPDVQLMA
jgi:hypothetical protein